MMLQNSMMSKSFIENAYALFWIRFTKMWDIDDMKMLFFPNLNTVHD